MVFKIDLEKTCDHIYWNFLKFYLKEKRFAPIMIILMMHYVISSSMSIIWNDSWQSNFVSTRGLMQGNHPLSPYLFVICMEFLLETIIMTVDEGQCKPVSLLVMDPLYCIYFFVDDVLLFAKVSNSQEGNIYDVLNHFAMFFDLKVSVTKSKVFFSDTTMRSKMDLIVSNTGIEWTLTLEKYLGFTMFHGRLQCKYFELTVEKISQRLTSWQHKLLNKVCCLTLVRFVLNYIPNEYMQVAWLPRPTYDFIDRVTMNILWKGNSNSGVPLVGWNKITKPKKLGGLWIKKDRPIIICWISLFESPSELWFYGFMFWSIRTSMMKRSLMWKRTWDQLLGMQIWKLSLLLRMDLKLNWKMGTPLYGFPIGLG